MWKSRPGKITMRMASEIQKSYQNLRENGATCNEALLFIQNDIKRRYSKCVSRGCLENYARYGFFETREKGRNKNNYEYRERERMRMKAFCEKRNPSFHMFEKYYDDFTHDKQPEEIEQNNDYLRALIAVKELQSTGVRSDSRRIAEWAGLESATKQLKILSGKKLIAHETQATFIIPERGKNFLKFLNLDN